MATPPLNEKKALEAALLSVMNAVITLYGELGIVRGALAHLSYNEHEMARQDVKELVNYDVDRNSLSTALKDLDVWIKSGDG